MGAKFHLSAISDIITMDFVARHRYDDTRLDVISISQEKGLFAREKEFCITICSSSGMATIHYSTSSGTPRLVVRSCVYKRRKLLPHNSSARGLRSLSNFAEYISRGVLYTVSLSKLQRLIKMANLVKATFTVDDSVSIPNGPEVVVVYVVRF